MTNRITILMPMGGLGQRFLDAGFETPKPLIKVDGKEMFLKALETFPSDWETDYIFVIRKDQDRLYNLKKEIISILPEAKVEVLDHNTAGPVETSLIAESLIDNELPIIIMDCDIRFFSKDYVSKIESGDFDGILASFESTDPRYSFATLDANGLVDGTVEKQAVSSHALLGGYYFSSGKLFLKFAHEFVDKPLPNGIKEYYLSHLFNLMISDEKKVGLAKVDSFDIWGTPEELEAYNTRQLEK